jgi:hypothetical protein
LQLRFAAYSAHDTTLLALATRLGIDIEPPEFSGYVSNHILVSPIASL